MGQLHELAYLNDADRLAIAICHSGHHVGLLYKDDADPSRAFLFHFCWHKILANAPPRPKDECTFWVVPSLELEHANSVIAHTVNIWQKQQGGTMPYGFSDPRGFFDSDGNIIFGPGQVGLTCATMILAIFDLSGVPLLEYDTWQPRSDDEAVQREFLQRLRARYPEDDDHFNEVENEVGSVRFRPLEVAGGALADDSPIDFSAAIIWAGRIQARIMGG